MRTDRLLEILTALVALWIGIHTYSVWGKLVTGAALGLLISDIGCWVKESVPRRQNRKPEETK